LTNKKLALCPYCGGILSKKVKTIDHIIPKQIGGCNVFTILSCQDCNSELSKIEQIAIGSQSISNLRAFEDESGHIIRSRRKKDYMQIQKSVGLAGRQTPVKFVYNNKTHLRELAFVRSPEEGLLEKKTFLMLMPDDKDSEQEKTAVVSMANKIALGTCAWLWGDNFSKTDQANVLRKSMRNMKEIEILDLGSDEKHLVLEENAQKDALDNEPHHTILIAKWKSKVIGLINLFGSYESMVTVGDYDETFREWLGEDGVIVISKTTINQVQKMTWKEYEKFKSKAVSNF
jgi:hypothetical protein